MTMTTKVGVGVGVLIVLAIAAWALGLFGTAGMGTGAQEATTTPQEALVQSDLPSGQADASDQALAQDAAAVDAQIGGLSNDSASIDQSINDQPVKQDY